MKPYLINVPLGVVLGAVATAVGGPMGLAWLFTGLLAGAFMAWVASR